MNQDHLAPAALRQRRVPGATNMLSVVTMGIAAVRVGTALSACDHYGI
ncbi:hypothetical protein [Blastomonas sp.]